MAWLVTVLAVAKPWSGAVLDQWTASYDGGEPVGAARYEALSRVAALRGRRLAAALVTEPAVIAAIAYARGRRSVARTFLVVTAVAALPAGLLTLSAL